MVEFYKRYAQKGCGLFLLPAPTGSGKTYSAVEFIYDELVNKKLNKQIIFCSNRVATSTRQPYEDLIKLIKKNYTEKEVEKFKKRVLQLHNDSYQFRDFFEKDWRQILPDIIVNDKKRVKKYKDLKKILQDDDQIDINNEIINSYVRNCKQDIWLYIKSKIDSKKDKNPDKNSDSLIFSIF